MKSLLALLTFGLLLPASAGAITAQSYIVMDMNGVVITEKNADSTQPIASITKLFTAEKNVELPQDELITITPQDVKNGQMRSSPLRAGRTYTRGVLLELSLVNSDNIAAVALGRSSAVELKLPSTISYVEASGLDPRNEASARALANHVRQLYQTDIASTSVLPNVSVGGMVRRSTNPLIMSPTWEFLLSKTGFIKAAGGCLVVLMKLKDQVVAVAILGSATVKQRWCDLAALRAQLDDTEFERPRCGGRTKKKRG